ncbi:zinc finger bed domain-containing protein 1-like [Gigaspora margarita]|uniref:Zinc finger bed domain-containing protein 1-like n=1 Tax=Gigaspora margarita TaxID=4874 RepID=A0A8H4ELN8_GIGMA|nr:zinc finger bed domain-containing protein 1-like [Gigaspora margarita]
MSNDQLTINTLRELNSRLVSEITELRKENTKILELKKKFVEVEAENTKVKTENAEISELKKKFAEIEAKNIKLKDAIKQSTRHEAEYKARIKKLEQKDNDTKGIDQSSVDITSTKIENSKNTPEQMDL